MATDSEAMDAILDMIVEATRTGPPGWPRASRAVGRRRAPRRSRSWPRPGPGWTARTTRT